MSAFATSKIFIVGGTGAQGMPVVKSLVVDRRYEVRVLTRDPSSRRARDLAKFDNVSFVIGTFADEDVLRSGMSGCDGVYLNIDGFNSGEKTEMYWAMRAYEIALEVGVKFFVYGNLDYCLKKGNYNSKYRTGHYDGKGRIGNWILAENANNQMKMGVALLTTGPYMEMAISSMTPMTPSIENGIVTWRVPLGSGSIPHVALEDCGFYARWLFDNPDRANGMNLEVAIEHVEYQKLAEAFTRVTGHPAQYIDITLGEYWEGEGPLKHAANLPTGYNADPSDKSTMSFKKNFTGFWNMWKDGIITRDYAFLDEIHPNRIKTAEEWLRREDELGKIKGYGSLWDRIQPERILTLPPILKLSEDKRKGIL